MGLPKPGEGYTSGEHFSDDVLKIELCGPSRSHFSVVDVPGLFQSMFPSHILFSLPQSSGSLTSDLYFRRNYSPN